MKQKKRKK